MATKWGIVCAGKIANDFCAALKLLSPDDHQIVAVASRSSERAKEFAERFGIPKSYGSYEELANDPGIDITYIAAVTSHHYRLVKIMLNYGKNVLCETPLTTHLELTKDLVQLARDKKLFLMEGHWTMFFPVWTKVREEFSSIGNVEFLSAKFGIDMTTVDIYDRMIAPSLGGGIQYELGSYLIKLALTVFGERPEKIVCNGSHFPNGVDATIYMTLQYSGGRFAQLACSATCNYVNSAEIMGSKGAFQILSPFWCPTRLKTPTEDFEVPLKEGKHRFNFENSAGLMYEAEYVRKCLQEGKTECELVPHEHSIIIAELTDEIIRQLGVTKFSEK